MSKIIVDPAQDRRGNDIDLQDLLESLSEVGLLHPILVLPADDEGNHPLLAGHRRLRAARRLGWEEVPVRIVALDRLRAELAALAENLVRKALPHGEELRAIARAKSIYEQLHPETKPGGARHRPSGQDGHLKIDSFADSAAKATGQSARTIRRKAMVGERASSKILDALDDGAISLGDAERIVALPVEDQDRQVQVWRSPRTWANAEPGAGSNRLSSLRTQALTRGLKRLLLATEAVGAELARVVASMDASTLQSCRQYLLNVQTSIAKLLTMLEQRLPERPPAEALLRAGESPG